jgi:hypothetical protein
LETLTPDHACAAQASRLVTVLLDTTEKIRTPPFSSFPELRFVLKRAAHQLAELAKDGARRASRRRRAALEDRRQFF